MGNGKRLGQELGKQVARGLKSARYDKKIEILDGAAEAAPLQNLAIHIAPLKLPLEKSGDSYSAAAIGESRAH